MDMDAIDIFALSIFLAEHLSLFVLKFETYNHFNLT